VVALNRFRSGGGGGGGVHTNRHAGWRSSLWCEGGEKKKSDKDGAVRGGHQVGKTKFGTNGGGNQVNLCLSHLTGKPRRWGITETKKLFLGPKTLGEGGGNRGYQETKKPVDTLTPVGYLLSETKPKCPGRKAGGCDLGRLPAVRPGPPGTRCLWQFLRHEHE